ncbi:MAG: flagellar M-ring protein FliF [bacterium]|nr:flagellar M-ring protein FliF [bacterium]
MAEEKSILPAPLKNFLNRFTPSQRIFLASAVILTVVGVILIVNLASTFTYGVLYSNLSPKDSGMILEQLKGRKTPYKIEAGGSVIRVPEDQIPELRIELAAAGLPEGSGVGFEIFDKTSLSTTDFVQNINYVRAIEGELARSITQLREVSSAKVHITLPKRSVFIEDQEPAKASIVLKLKPGAHVTGNIVPAILHLTAQSVEGLKPENIAIVDVYGSLLSKPSDGTGDDAFDDKQLGYQKKMENNFSRKIVTLLEPIVGAGRVRANVKLSLDFNKIETTEETVDPDLIAKVSEKSETKSSSGGTVAGGIPGVASNVAQAGGGQPGGAASSPAKSKAENSLVNYEVSKRVTHTIRPVGGIQKVSAAVVIDDGVRVQLVNGELQRESQKRTAEELAALTRIVRAAVGYSADRGDIVEVVNLAFDTSAAAESDYLEGQQKSEQFKDDLIRYGLYILGILVLFFFIVRPVMKKISQIFKNIGKPKVEEIEIPRIDGDKMAALQGARDDAEIERELLEQYKIPKASKKSSIIRQKVSEFAEENLEETASLIKSFLMED